MTDQKKLLDELSEIVDMENWPQLKKILTSHLPASESVSPNAVVTMPEEMPEVKVFHAECEVNPTIVNVCYQAIRKAITNNADKE